MDTSEKYIEMCEKAIEIQESWNPIDGDFACGKTRSLEKINGIIKGTIKIGEAKVYNKNCRFIANPALSVWLPRQDQLQDMVSLDPGWLLMTGLDDFNDWEEGSGLVRERDNYNSMEQLWLAYVMEKKYNKTWNGKEWIQN